MKEENDKVGQDKNKFYKTSMNHVMHEKLVLEKRVQILQTENINLKTLLQKTQNEHRVTEQHLHSVLNSRIWQHSRLYRFVMDRIRLLIQRIKRKIRKTIKAIIVRMITIVNKSNVLRKMFLKFLNLFPVLKVRLKRMNSSTIKPHSADKSIEAFHSELNKDFNFIHFWLTHQRNH